MLVTWTTYLGLVRSSVDHDGWPAEVWTGAPVMAALVAAGVRWLVGGRRASSPSPEERTLELAPT